MNGTILYIRSAITAILVLVSAAMLFVPVVDGAGDIKAMFLMLTGIAVRDLFGAVQEDRRVEQIKQAYDPTPPESFVYGKPEA